MLLGGIFLSICIVIIKVKTPEVKIWKSFLNSQAPGHAC